MKYKTLVGKTEDEIDKLCNEFEECHDVKFSTPYVMLDGAHARLIRYEGDEQEVASAVPTGEPAGEVLKPSQRDNKKWIECPGCKAKGTLNDKGLPVNIMVSTFPNCKKCGYQVPVSVLNEYR